MNSKQMKRHFMVNTREKARGDEVLLHRVPDGISAEQLVDDNNSERAREGLEQWIKRYAGNEVIISVGCADARQHTAVAIGLEQTLPFSSIAASGIIELASAIEKLSPHSRCVFVVGHFDGDTMKPGQPPGGCGGLAEFRKMQDSTSESPRRGALSFVEQHIDSPDVVANTLVKSQQLAEALEQTNPTFPVVAAVIDHRTQKLFILAILTHGGKRSSSAIPLLNFDLNNPMALYTDAGWPKTLDITPDLLSVYPWLNDVKTNNDVVVGQNSNPEYSARQAVQQPSAMVITAAKPSNSLRFPELFGRPNTAFTIGYAREKQINEDDEEEYVIDNAMLEAIRDQAEYPIIHASKAESDKENGHSQPFWGLKTILIEGRTMDHAEQIFATLCQEEWMKDWLKIENNKVHLAETRGGLIKSIKTVEHSNMD